VSPSGSFASDASLLAKAAIPLSNSSVPLRCVAPAQLNGAEALRISIRDNGPRFAADQRAKSFEPFFTTKVRDTGLGLAICKRIVEAHAGRIEAGAGPEAEVVTLLPWSDE
jgi:nitrogen fixation/metabolism regulation signal transduction histidine kinase